MPEEKDNIIGDQDDKCCNTHTNVGNGCKFRGPFQDLLFCMMSDDKVLRM